MSNKISIAIVGAGASGLFSAKKMSENSANQLFLFEKSTKVGTKLKASGGGKANILNTDIQDFHYNN
ncbi:MAG TPA: NAD(P)/FAD-dependent oxidoreductase, partial [Bacteroidales bacterium]|nr:NAD(P)/FAD-dependent oxidoreductase [Bacteroidales bacterium]